MRQGDTASSHQPPETERAVGSQASLRREVRVDPNAGFAAVSHKDCINLHYVGYLSKGGLKSPAGH